MSDTLNVYGLTPLGFREKVKLNYDTTYHDDGAQVNLSRQVTDKRDYDERNIYWGNMNYPFDSASSVSISNWDIVNSVNSGQEVINAYKLYWTAGSSVPLIPGELTWLPDSINNCASMFRSTDITGSPVVPLNADNCFEMFSECTKLTGRPVCPDLVVNADYMYHNCFSLDCIPVVGNNVVSAHAMYHSTSAHGEIDLRYKPKLKNIDYMFTGCKDLWIYTIGSSYIDQYMYYNFSKVFGCSREVDTSRGYDFYGSVTRNVHVYAR